MTKYSKIWANGMTTTMTTKRFLGLLRASRVINKNVKKIGRSLRKDFIEMLLETLMNNDALRSQAFLAARQHHTDLFCKHYPLAYILTKIRVFQFFDTEWHEYAGKLKTFGLYSDACQCAEQITIQHSSQVDYHALIRLVQDTGWHQYGEQKFLALQS